ncbi:MULTISPECIES: hypothetical protein [Modicisalibacter]|uniref:MarR family transcriptional regulator n=1 Tax=Modicisalibacter tunisiensis TaxID=390637 RepID=A0ABS7WXF3_9GAMM|nr:MULTISPECIES: hypothetical protein [Modicisalibacter]MBZ9539307.1 hypothetical protein [Modicisalibacter tunisiensis]MBZ9567298.1 hypothetical protein [Modicisalibacter tunisiensis]
MTAQTATASRPSLARRFGRSAYRLLERLTESAYEGYRRQLMGLYGID